MASDTETSLDATLVSETQTYLDLLTSCVELTPRLVERYAAGRSHQETVEEIRSLESACDECNRRIGGNISNSSSDEGNLRSTRIHLNSTAIRELSQRLDDIANATEKVAEDLATVRPAPVDHYFHQFEEMATLATTAMAALEEAVTTFVALRCRPAESGSIADAVSRVRAAESSCDGRRNEVVTQAFADDDLDDPLVYREFALRFDHLVDAIEDVTDQLVLVATSEPWVTAEPS